MRKIELDKDRLHRSRIFYFLIGLLITALLITVLWQLDALILPTIVGLISAYICIPVLNYFYRKNIPKSISLFILFISFLILGVGLALLILQTIPNEKEELELRVQVQYKINKSYMELMGKDSINAESGNILFDFFGNDLDPVIIKFNNFVRLNPEENILFLQYVGGHKGKGKISPRVIGYFHELNKLSIPVQKVEEGNSKKFGDGFRFVPILSKLSHWIIMPFVFLFMLIDDGQIKRFFMSFIPNRYFEMSLTTISNVDNALGSYLRGTLLECLAVGATISFGLILIGINVQAALIIGIITGLANAIPIFGPVLSLVLVLGYSVLTENVSPLIPFLSGSDIIIAGLVIVLLAQFLDEVIYQPLIIGKAVQIHPIVVVLGVAAGSLLFGFTGTLLAIPSIVIFKVILSTIYTQLKAYFIIY